MPYNPAIHHRRSIRLKGYDYSQSGLYFVTPCVMGRLCLFGEIVSGEMILNDTGKIIDEEWQYLKIKYPHIQLHEYVIMPNHFHGIVEITDIVVGAGSARPDNETVVVNIGQANPAPTGTRTTLGNIIGYFKYQTTKKINLPTKLWQRNYYEHIIRNELSYERIANYIIENPVRWSGDRFYKA